jgi:hypothetical protein
MVGSCQVGWWLPPTDRAIDGSRPIHAVRELSDWLWRLCAVTRGPVQHSRQAARAVSGPYPTRKDGFGPQCPGDRGSHAREPARVGLWRQIVALPPWSRVG